MGAASEKYDCSEDARMEPQDCMFGNPSTDIKCYKMKEKKLCIKESYKVKDQDDHTVFKCKGIFFTLRDRMVLYGHDDDEGDELAVIQKKLCSCLYNREIFKFVPSWEGQHHAEDEYEGKRLYRWGIVERRCINCCTGASYDYYKYTKDGEKQGIYTAKEQCCSCLFNMKVVAYGTEQVVGQVGDCKFWEFLKESFAITCAKGTDNAALVALGIIVDDIREDVQRDAAASH
jgi:hypothetical protein